MYQHITNHGGMHDVYYPAIGESSMVTSTHHQLVMIPEDALPIAWAYPNRSSMYFGPDAKETEGPEHEIEAAVYPEHNVFGAQFHPEFSAQRHLSPEGFEHYECLLNDFLDLDISEFTARYGYRGEYNGERPRRREAAQDN